MFSYVGWCYFYIVFLYFFYYVYWILCDIDCLRYCSDDNNGVKYLELIFRIDEVNDLCVVGLKFKVLVVWEEIGYEEII